METTKKMPDQATIKFCFDKEFHAFGTKYLFEQRAISLRGKLKLLSWSSLVIPLAVATLLLSFDSTAVTFWTKLISGLLGGALTFIGLWAVVAGWTDSLSKAERAMLANTDLIDRWRDLQAYSGPDFDARLAVLKERDLAQEKLDQLESVTQKDKALMMRAALFQYQMPCTLCNESPKSLKPGKHNCARCANP
jgi:mobilome CxxCx(11)CxxC protein